MKKSWIAIAIALLAIAYPASAWLIGKNVESALIAYTHKLQADAPFIKVTKRNFQRGVYLSTEDITIEIAGELMRSISQMQKTSDVATEEPAEGDESKPDVAVPSEPLKPITLTFRNHIKHGPFAGGRIAVAKIETEMLFEEKLQQEISKAFAGKKPLELVTSMDWGGGGTTTVMSPVATVALQQGAGTMNWQGLQGRIDFSKNVNGYRADLTSAGLEFTGGPKKETVKIVGIQMLSDKKRLSENSMLYLGSDKGTIKEMSFSSATEPAKAFTLADITYLGDVREDGGFADIVAKMGAAKLSVGADGYGPAHYDLSFKHLHAATLEKFIKAFGEIYSGRFKTPEEMTAASLAPWKNHGPELLKHNPELTIDRISFTTPDGEATFKGTVKIPGATAEDVANPLGLITKIDAAVDIALPEALVAKLAGAGKETAEEKVAAAEMVQQQLQGVEQQGYITRADKMLKSHLEWKNGKGTINGKPFQLPGGAPQ